MSFDKSLDYHINEHNQEMEECEDCNNEYPINQLWICSPCTHYICDNCKDEHGHMFYSNTLTRA